MRGALAVVVALALAPALAAAQEQGRPDEGSMFGAPAESPSPDGGTPVPPTQREAPKPPEDNRDTDALTQGTIKDRFAEGGATEDPLKIGGRFYVQGIASGANAQDVRDARFSSPTLVDGYFDARPNERIRAMVVGRLQFDASQASGTTTTQGLQLGPDLMPQAVTRTTNNPTVLLDQAWLNFDIEHHVFLTVGRQHVKWGTGRIWNPTDFLTPARRDPLAFIDTRLGTSMVKVHVPWEAAAANFYGYGLLDVDGPANALRQLGGALRAEAVLFKTVEVGLGGILQKGHQPRFAVDLSTPLGPFNVYGEVAIKQGADDGPHVRACSPCTGPSFAGYELYQPDGWTPAATAGLEWTFAYAENKTATVGAEYFYNSGGYPDAKAYPVLLATGLLSPFYLGEHNAALFATLIGPGTWDKASFLLFNLANLSDKSFVSRLNFSLQVLTYLTVDAFASVHYGNPAGAFRLGLQIDPIPGVLPDGLNLKPALWDAGMGLRVNL